MYLLRTLWWVTVFRNRCWTKKITIFYFIFLTYFHVESLPLVALVGNHPVHIFPRKNWPGMCFRPSTSNSIHSRIFYQIKKQTAETLAHWFSLVLNLYHPTTLSSQKSNHRWLNPPSIASGGAENEAAQRERPGFLKEIVILSATRIRRERSRVVPRLQSACTCIPSFLNQTFSGRSSRRG